MECTAATAMLNVVIGIVVVGLGAVAVIAHAALVEVRKIRSREAAGAGLQWDTLMAQIRREPAD